MCWKMEKKCNTISFSLGDWLALSANALLSIWRHKTDRNEYSEKEDWLSTKVRNVEEKYHLGLNYLPLKVEERYVRTHLCLEFMCQTSSSIASRGQHGWVVVTGQKTEEPHSTPGEYCSSFPSLSWTSSSHLSFMVWQWISRNKIKSTAHREL